jgi:hypothetical protein
MTEQFMETWEANVNELGESFSTFPWQNEECYKQYLAQSYYYAIHSVRLLQFAADETSDPELKDRLLDLLKDEMGQENLALNDLRNFGVDIESYPELEETKELYEQIYEGIDLHGPAAILGYAITLGGFQHEKLLLWLSN